MTVPTSAITMTNLNTVFGSGFSLSRYYGAVFGNGTSAPSTGAIGYSTFSGKTFFNPSTSVSSATLITWFKGDSGLTSSSWTNYGTNTGSNATLTTGTAVSTINGRNVADFTAGGATYPHGTFGQNFSGQPRAIFVAMKFVSTPTSNQHIIAISNAFDFTIIGGTELMLIQQGVGIRLWTTGMPAIPAGTTCVFGIKNSAISTSSNAAYFNGTSISFQSNATASSYTTGSVTTNINYYGVGTTNSPNYICEILCYDGELNATDATNINKYLKYKWGVA